MIAKCILASPASGHSLPWQQILQAVLQRWFAGHLVFLWSEACAHARSFSNRARPAASSSSQQRSNARRARLAVQNGQFTKAIKALSSESLALPSPLVMQDKHPQAPPPSLPPCPVPSSMEISDRGRVKSFPKGSAPGLSGLHSSYLHKALCCPSPD